MSGGPAWRALGIAPTPDQQAIRRAYAAKLKAIDPDRDPQAFIALRQAFEQARREAQWIALEPEPEDAIDDTFDEEEWSGPVEPHVRLPTAIGEPVAFAPRDAEPHPEPLPPRRDGWEGPAENSEPASSQAASAPEPVEPPRPSPWVEPTPEQFDDHARSLARILLADHDSPWPDEAETAAMLDHWEAIRRDPRLHNLSFLADAEQWFADMIARSCPFSDPLVAPVTDWFGWMKEAGAITQSPATAHVVRRRRALDFLAAIRRRGHPLNPAYRELVTPAHEGSRRGMVSGRSVRRLLGTIRREFPDLEDNFDAYRVSLWDASPARGWRGWNFAGVLVVWALIALFHFGSRYLPETGSSLPPPIQVVGTLQLQNERVDADRALADAFGPALDIGAIEMRNPDLAAEIEKSWKAAFAKREDFMDWSKELRALLDQRFLGGLSTASLGRVAEFHAITLERARRLRETGPRMCAAYLKGEAMTGVPTPEDLRDRLRGLMAQVLLETKGGKPRPAGTNRFTVSSAILDTAAERAGMSRSALGDAMVFKGTPEAICNGRIAFLETVLAMPRAKVATLLRAM